MERLDEANLAWALAQAVKPQLNVGERNYIFVAIGAGDLFAAIRALIKWVVLKRIPVPPDLALRCASWLDAYVGHEDEKSLRRLIEDFVFPVVIQACATLRANRLPTTPRRSQLAALTRV
jgi:xanthosine utilization system XapX-like protein